MGGDKNCTKCPRVPKFVSIEIDDCVPRRKSLPLPNTRVKKLLYLMKMRLWI